MDTIELKVKETPTSEELGILRWKILDIYLEIKSKIIETISKDRDKDKFKELNVTRDASDEKLISWWASLEQSILFPTEDQRTEIKEQWYSLRDRVLIYIKNYNEFNKIKLMIYKDDSYRKEKIWRKLESINGSNNTIIEVLQTEDNKIFFVCSNKDDSSFWIYPSDK